jgi:exo-1,4-beta-D-glucosaminidase
MPEAQVETRNESHQDDGWATSTVTLTNHSKSPAFFVRAEVVNGADGEEILPITWNDNYVTLFAGESKLIGRHKVADAPGGHALLAAART